MQQGQMYVCMHDLLASERACKRAYILQVLNYYKVPNEDKLFIAQRGCTFLNIFQRT